jgi:uncharacterized protein YabE (DUF348 family)
MVSTTSRPLHTDSRPEIEILHNDSGPVPDPSPSRHDPDRKRSRIVVAAAAAVLVIIVIAGSIYYVAGGVTVNLVVDGRSQTIETRAGTVADLLDRQGIGVSDVDHVTPSPAAELTDTVTVEVRHARPFLLVIDGRTTSHTTTGLTVGEALTALSAPVEGAALSAPLDRPVPLTGITVEIITAKTMAISDGGRTRNVTTTAETVADLLADEQIVLSATDTVSPAPGSTVVAGMTVHITRVRVENEVRTEVIPHATSESNDASLVVGSRKVDTEGVDGVREVVYAVTYTNGEPTAEETVSSNVVTEPVTEVVRIGTKPAPVVDPGVSAGGEADGLNWAALAECESSGNPRAVNPAGYYGLYQFSLSTWASVGGSGNPVDASPDEQTMRAKILFNKAGPGQWPHCGPRLFT